MLIVDIIFGSDPGNGDEIDFNLAKIATPAVKTSRILTFVTSGAQAEEINIPTPTATPGEASALAYKTAFELFYSAKVNSIVIVTTTTVRITFNNHPDTLLCFLIASDFSSDDVGVTNLFVQCTLQTFSLVEVLFDEAVVPCSDVEVSIETDEVAPEIWLNGVQIETVNAANPYIIDVSRGIPHRFNMINAGLDELPVPALDLDTYLFPTFGAAQIDVDIAPSLAGATLTVTVIRETGNPAITFTYSIDDAAYQNSNVFTGQADGAGTMYVLDNWGCKQSVPYNVTEVGTRDPYLFISGANSIGFVESEVIDGCSIFRNDNNTVAINGLEDITFCEQLLFQTCDTTTIQFKTNFDTPTAYVRHEDGSADTNLSLTQKSANLNRFKSMDCWYYKYKTGLLGIYFTSGDTYDDLDIAIDGGEFTLNGNLPDFAIVGQFIDIDTLGVFQIVDIVYDATILKKAIIVEYIYDDVATETFVKSTFDLLPFEVWEFTIDWSAIGVGVHDVIIDNSDTLHTTVQHLSENISVLAEHEKTLAIRYKNFNNRDIFYKYNIEHFIRIPYLHVEGSSLEESEVNITDLTSVITDSSVHELDIFHFEEVTKAVMRKITIALSMESVFINGIGYIKNGGLSTENIEGTNLYLIKADMLKTNINYNNNRQGQEGLDEDTIDFNIEPFVFGDGGFVKS